MRASVSASYSSLVGSVSVEVDTSYSNSVAEESALQNSTIELIGGNASVDVKTSDGSGISTFMESIPGNPELAAFGENPLIPIWMFIATLSS